ncbi:MAG TPA: hypothetical protein VMJ34_16285 [Bryobacteraceae bacterium]|nr:hypothetical protein [Bryobacteraceae bacterium]
MKTAVDGGVVQMLREHPEYRARKPMWRMYRDLYAGGEQMRANAGEYLIRRNKEPLEVYAERLSRVFYENYAGSIIDWYAATLFHREPVLTFEGTNDAARRFYGEFIGDCDRKGTGFTEFFRSRFIEALVYGRSYILIDFPRASGTAGTRAEEDALGSSRAYLLHYTPDELINWGHDEHGNFEWVVLRTGGLRKLNAEDAAWTYETRWAYFDKDSYRIYSERQETSTFPTWAWPEDAGKKAVLMDAGVHGLAKLRRVPLVDLSVPEGMWLMNKAAMLQLEHFNKSNALSWALTMGLFAMPVIYSERDWNQLLGESYYLQLGKDDKFGWTEPQGHVFQIAADNLARLQQEIYRVCYTAQAGGDLAGSGVQSGLSKQRDFAITQEVLRAYGDAVKESMRRVLGAVDAAREDEATIDVSGMDEFDMGDFAAELADARGLLDLGIESPTLRKQVFKRLALKYLCDSRQSAKDQIAREIEEGRNG